MYRQIKKRGIITALNKREMRKTFSDLNGQEIINTGIVKITLEREVDPNGIYITDFLTQTVEVGFNELPKELKELFDQSPR